MSPDVRELYATNQHDVVRRFMAIMKLYDLHYGSTLRRVSIRVWLWWRRRT